MAVCLPPISCSFNAEIEISSGILRNLCKLSMWMGAIGIGVGTTGATGAAAPLKSGIGGQSLPKNHRHNSTRSLRAALRDARKSVM